MGRLFKRDAWVEIGDIRPPWVDVGTLRVQGLQLRFRATKDAKGDPDTLDLMIHNLSAASRAKLQHKDVPVVLAAGYEGNVQVIYEGNARTVDHVRQGADWVTHVQCGSGEQAFAPGAMASFSLGPGATLGDVMKQLMGGLKGFGIGVDDAMAELQNKPAAALAYPRGYVASAPIVREIDRVAKFGGLQWWIRGRNFVLLDPDETTKETAILLSAETGLILSPDHGVPQKDGSESYLKARALLTPGLEPGRAVQIESQNIKGLYRVEKVTHEGDLFGSAWSSSIEALPVKAGT